MLKKLMAIALIAGLVACAGAPTAGSATDETAAVATAAENLRLAMIDPTRENLSAIVSDDLSFVRHTLAADSNDGGKPGKVLIKILGVWQKQGGQWKMIARQAIRPPA